MTRTDALSPGSGLLPFALRITVGFLALWAALAAWWFPQPLLVSAQEVDWGARYAAAYGSNKSGFGYMGAMRDAIRADTAVLPMPIWIEQETLERTGPLAGGEGAMLLAGVREQQPGPDGRRVLTLPAGAPLLTGLEYPEGGPAYLSLSTDAGLIHLALSRIAPSDYGYGDLPAALRFPFRAHWPWLLGLAALGVAVVRWRPARQSRLAGSMAGTGIRWSLGLLAAGLVVAIFPFPANLGIDGIGVVALGTVLALFGLIALWVTGWHALIVGRLLAGQGLLGRWVYPREDWQRFATKDAANRREEGKAFALLAIGVSILVLTVVLVFAQDKQAALLAAGVVVAAFVLGGIAVWSGSRAMARRLDTTQVEVLIGRDGLWMNGITHVWRGMGARLEAAEIEEGRDGRLLAIAYSVPQSAGGRIPMFYRRTEVIRLPIPGGDRAAAQKILAGLLPAC